MRKVSSEFECSRAELLTLIDAASTHEEILFEGIKCVVEMEPTITEAEKSKLKKVCPCVITSSSTSQHKSELTTGLFKYKKFNISEINNRYTVILAFDGNVEEKNKEVSLRIKSSITNKIEQGDVKTLNKEDKRKWLEENADSYQEGSNCSVM